jgi:hypothetical protein
VVDTATVMGGAAHALGNLQPNEYALAKAALAKIGASDPTRSVSGSDSVVVGAGNATLLGIGHETALGGGSGHLLGSDTLTAGSGLAALSHGHGNLGGETINVAGQTAASFHDVANTKPPGVATTIKLGDKTTVNLIGIKIAGAGKPH